MDLRESFVNMVETTGCSEQLVMLLFNTGELDVVAPDQLPTLLRGIIGHVAYNKDGVSYAVCVAPVNTLKHFNLKDEKFEYVKYAVIE